MLTYTLIILMSNYRSAAIATIEGFQSETACNAARLVLPLNRGERGAPNHDVETFCIPKLEAKR